MVENVPEELKLKFITEWLAKNILLKEVINSLFKIALVLKTLRAGFFTVVSIIQRKLGANWNLFIFTFVLIAQFLIYVLASYFWAKLLLLYFLIYIILLLPPLDNTIILPDLHNDPIVYNLVIMYIKIFSAGECFLCLLGRPGS